MLAYLAQQRHVLRVTAYGLTDEQARATPAASALSVGGLIKHVAAMERGWINTVLQREETSEEDHEAGFRLGPDETLASVLGLYDEVAKETEAVIAEISDLGQAVPVPRGVPWFPDDVEAWSVRWVLLHLIEETARHAGHADIVRESLDGATAFPLLAAAEGWPASRGSSPGRLQLNQRNDVVNTASSYARARKSRLAGCPPRSWTACVAAGSWPVSPLALARSLSTTWRVSARS